MSYEYRYVGIQKNGIYNLKDKEMHIAMITAYMLDRLSRIFKINGLPDTMPEREIKLMLLTNGNIWTQQINKSQLTGDYESGVYGFTGALGGEPSIYLTPTRYITANPRLLTGIDSVIGVDGVLIRNDSLMIGVLPVINKYATLLAESWLSLQKILINSRHVGVGSAQSQKLANQLKEYFKAIEAGEDFVIVDKILAMETEGVKIQPLAQTSVNAISQQIEAIQYIWSMMLMEIGLNSNFNMKRESLNAEETELNNDSLTPFIDDMHECWDKGWNDFNDMFGYSVSVDFDSAWKDRQLLIKADDNIEKSELTNDDNKEGDDNDKTDNT